MTTTNQASPAMLLSDAGGRTAAGVAYSGQRLRLCLLEPSSGH
jgi:hypothetical protein